MNAGSLILQLTLLFSRLAGGKVSVMLQVI